MNLLYAQSHPPVAQSACRLRLFAYRITLRFIRPQIRCLEFALRSKPSACRTKCLSASSLWHCRCHPFIGLCGRKSACPSLQKLCFLRSGRLLNLRHSASLQPTANPLLGFAYLREFRFKLLNIVTKCKCEFKKFQSACRLRLFAYRITLRFIRPQIRCLEFLPRSWSSNFVSSALPLSSIYRIIRVCKSCLSLQIALQFFTQVDFAAYGFAHFVRLHPTENPSLSGFQPYRNPFEEASRVRIP